ncbi:thioesterase domain-containing protein [Streptomyces sp. NPDC002262]|uniref:thioesterase II family protein n=1 Tax=unclassified Streptomyces TaxID=2593676 RepID=UPI00332E8156
MGAVTATGAERWLRRYGQAGGPGPTGVRTRLFCLHFAGGSASAFRDWPDSLPPHIAVEALMLPGRERRFREPPIDRMDVLVDALVEALRPRLDLPYALFGYSFGAQVSFHLAHALRAAGLPMPVGLFVGASAGPSVLGEVPGVRETDEELIAYMRDLGGVGDDVLGEPDMLDLVLPALRADLTAVATCPYTPRPALDLPVHAFSGEDDPTTARPSLMAEWSRETTGPFTQTVHPGGHFFIDHAREDLVAAIAEDLDRLTA